MSRIKLDELDYEGSLDIETMRDLGGGNSRSRRTRRSRTRRTRTRRTTTRAATDDDRSTSGSRTNHGANTHDPSTDGHGGGHDHQTDGIHDDNGRIGNNGLGAGPVRRGRGGRGGRSRGRGSRSRTPVTTTVSRRRRGRGRGRGAARQVETGGSSGDHGNEPLGIDVSHIASATREEGAGRYVGRGRRRSYRPGETVIRVGLKPAARGALPSGQKVGSSLTVEDTQSYTTRRGGRSVRIEVSRPVTITGGEDTKVRDVFSFKRTSGKKGYGAEMDVGVEYTRHRGGWTTWTDGKGNKKWLEDPVALDLNGDGHISTTGVGSGVSTQRNLTAHANFQRTGRISMANSDATESGGVAHQRGYIMDWNNDGRKLEAVSFATGKDAFLAIDRDGDGKITKGNELFGPTTGHGMKELAGLDSNKDGRLDKNDKDWGKLKLVSVNNVTRQRSYTYRYYTGGYTWRRVRRTMTLSSGRTYTYYSYRRVADGTPRRLVTRTYHWTTTSQEQSLRSLGDEGIASINLGTLKKASTQYDPRTGFGAGTNRNAGAVQNQTERVLREAQRYTGRDNLTNMAANLGIENAGTPTQTTNVASTFRQSQAGFTVGLGTRTAQSRSSSNSNVPNAGLGRDQHNR